MDKRRRILVAALVLATLGALACMLFLRPEPEPVYQGKRLSQWLKEGYHRGIGGGGREADDAVRAIGKDAIPTLLKMLRTKDSPFEKPLMWLAQHQSLVKIRFDPMEAYDWRWRGSEGFRALGPEGKQALPEVIPMFQDPNTAGYAATAMSTMGPETVSILQSGLTNRDEWIRAASAHALMYSGTNAWGTVPDLLARLNDPSRFVRQQAGHTLGALGQQPDLVLPGLIKLLQDPVPFVREVAVGAIGGFGTRATSAVPAIVKAISESSVSERAFRDYATNALQRINEAKVKSEDPN